MLSHIPMLLLAWLTIAKCPIMQPESVSFSAGRWWVSYPVYSPYNKAWDWWAKEDRLAYLVWAAEMANLVRPQELPLDGDSRWTVRTWVEIYRQRWFGRYPY